MSNNISSQLQLINQAINASMNSLGLTKQLIRDLERMQGGEGKSQNMGANRTVDMPGITGVYDGDNMVTEKGEKFAVPQNYASKSELVFGDTLKRIEEKSGAFLFKQIQRVKRYRQDGVLVKKEGKWAVVTDGGSYKTLNASVEHFKLKEGDEVFAILPEGNKNCPFAAISLKSSLISYDYSLCSQCLCCYELCPRRAIRIKKNFAAKFYFAKKKDFISFIRFIKR